MVCSSTSFNVIELQRDVVLSYPIKRDRHTRGNKAFIIHDIVSNSLILGQKLTTLATHLNENYARSSLENVSTRGLFEASVNHNGYTKGYHKNRYRVTSHDLDTAHTAFEQARQGIDTASMITELRQNNHRPPPHHSVTAVRI